MTLGGLQQPYFSNKPRIISLLYCHSSRSSRTENLFGFLRLGGFFHFVINVIHFTDGIDHLR